MAAPSPAPCVGFGLSVVWVSLPLQPRVTELAEVSCHRGPAAVLAWRLSPHCAGPSSPCSSVTPGPQCQHRARGGTDGPALPRAAEYGWELQAGGGQETLGSLGLCCASPACAPSARCPPVPPCLSTESPECGPGVHAVLRALESRWDGRAAPGRARGGFGEQESPGGAQGCGVDQHPDALCLNFLPSAEPISSGITCTVWGRDSLARHGSAQPRRQPHPGR